MTVLAELGAHNWQDYTDYWREGDAEWLQARSILRVTAPGDLNALPTPGVGQVVHVKDVTAVRKDVLYMYASQGAGPTTPGWVPYAPLPKNLFATEDSVDRVTMGHHPNNVANVVPALAFSPTGLDVMTDFRVRTSVLRVTASDVQIKTGATAAALTTDATSLVSNVTIKAPGFISSGPISAPSQSVTVGSVTAGTISSTGAINTVSISASGAISAASLSAAGGLTVGSAKYEGNASGAVIKGANFAAGKTQMLVYTDYVQIIDGTTYMDNQLAIRQNRAINFYNAAGTHIGYGGPVIYSSSDPGGPNGTIWVIP